MNFGSRKLLVGILRSISKRFVVKSHIGKMYELSVRLDRRLLIVEHHQPAQFTSACYVMLCRSRNRTGERGRDGNRKHSQANERYIEITKFQLSEDGRKIKCREEQQPMRFEQMDHLVLLNSSERSHEWKRNSHRIAIHRCIWITEKDDSTRRGFNYNANVSSHIRLLCVRDCRVVSFTLYHKEAMGEWVLFSLISQLPIILPSALEEHNFILEWRNNGTSAA